MSVRATNWVWGLQCVSGNSKLVLMALADCADDMGKCWPSMATIAKKAVASETTVRRAIAGLIDAGLLKKEERTRRDGSQSSNAYFLMIDAVGDGWQGNGDVDGLRDDTPPLQNDTPPHHNGEATPSPAAPHEPPTNHFPPNPPGSVKSGDGVSGKRTRRRKSKQETPLPPDRQQVFIAKDTLQWVAWAKARARPWPTTDRRNPETFKYETGWWFPSEWPPGHERGEAS